MAFLNNFRLAFLAMLMLALHLELTSAGVEITNIKADSLYDVDPAGNKADAYVMVWCNGLFGGSTGYREDTNYPRWSREFIFSYCGVGDTLKLQVWDSDWDYDDNLFTCTTQLKSGSYTYTCKHYHGTLYLDYRVY
ncbi:perforin-1-like [Triplophysa dalaica]|uniref:perforin-1-like n=1 Tax=Triplophysa dalaica TaxID=1582913 RepID=UPI0024E03038|nr:perforin-1-like [Triplophysa dalaica]